MKNLLIAVCLLFTSLAIASAGTKLPPAVDHGCYLTAAERNTKYADAQHTIAACHLIVDDYSYESVAPGTHVMMYCYRIDYY